MSLFDDKRVLTAFIALWTSVSAATFYYILLTDHSPFLNFGPNKTTILMGVPLDTWTKWWCVATYTFVSTSIAAFASDAIVPWITNTIQDHKTQYIPYSKFTCLVIMQVFTIYAVLMSVIGMFVALSQIDFMFIRIAADLSVNHVTLFWFLRGKKTDLERYREQQSELRPLHSDTKVQAESEARFVRRITRAAAEALSIVTARDVAVPDVNSPRYIPMAGNAQQPPPSKEAALTRESSVGVREPEDVAVSVCSTRTQSMRAAVSQGLSDDDI